MEPNDKLTQTTPPSADGKKSNFKRKWLWSVLSVGIAACTIWAVTSQNQQFSADYFKLYLTKVSPALIVPAILCMLGFIAMEGAALAYICRSFGYRTRPGDGWVYSSSDIYFSAITPSATGGQPASAYFMMRDGIPGTVVTVALIVNLAVYTASIVFIGLLSFIFRFGVFSGFSVLSKVLILVGTAFQTGLIVLFVLLLRHGTLLYSICDAGLRLLCRLRIFHRRDERRAKLRLQFEEYSRRAKLAMSHRKMLLFAFLFNFLQRVAQILVAVFTYLATGGSLSHAFDIWALQSYVVLGSNCIPVPGAMGVADYLMLDGYGRYMSAEEAVNLELLTRSISFYVCIIICGVSVLFAYFWRKARSRKS